MEPGITTFPIVVFPTKSELQGVLGCDWCKLFIFDLNILNMKTVDEMK